MIYTSNIALRIRPTIRDFLCGIATPSPIFFHFRMPIHMLHADVLIYSPTQDINKRLYPLHPPFVVFILWGALLLRLEGKCLCDREISLHLCRNSTGRNTPGLTKRIHVWTIVPSRGCVASLFTHAVSYISCKLFFQIYQGCFFGSTWST